MFSPTQMLLLLLLLTRHSASGLQAAVVPLPSQALRQLTWLRRLSRQGLQHRLCPRWHGNHKHQVKCSGCMHVHPTKPVEQQG